MLNNILKRYASQIEVISSEVVSEGFDTFSQPFLIRAGSTSIETQAWSDGSRLVEIFGPDFLVPVTKGEECLEMKLADFLTSESDSKSNGGSSPKYLKDFHAVSDALLIQPQLQLYSVPLCFRDDWLNGFYDSMSVGLSMMKDFRFMYIGREGSNTKLHHDVMASHSWSLNLSGCKMWFFIRPDDAKQYYDVWGNLQISSLLNRDDILTIQRAFKTKEAISDTFQLLSGPIAQLTHELFFTIQLPGESVFVPSSWHHEVLNLGEGFITSVNQNWIEANGLNRMQQFLQKELSSIRERTRERVEPIYDSSFERHCQKLLRYQTGGFDLCLFGKFLLFKADQVLQHANDTIDVPLDAHGHPYYSPHIKTDQATLLTSIVSLIDALEKLAQDPFIANLTVHQNDGEEEEEIPIRVSRCSSLGFEHLDRIHEQLRVPKVRSFFSRNDLIESAKSLKVVRSQNV